MTVNVISNTADILGNDAIRALCAVVKQTLRSCIRSRVFHVLLGLILLAVVLLPITVSGDGTARGLVQICLTYSLGVVTLLISTATLWLGCANLSREIEAYNLHLVVTKPTSPWLVWVGKWLGVLLMHVLLLIVAAAVIWGLVTWRLSRGELSAEELFRVKSEVMVGRRQHRPEQLDFEDLTKREYQARCEAGTIDPKHDRDTVMYEILRQVKAKSTEVPPDYVRYFVFRNVRVSDPEKPISLRYRYYVGNIKSLNAQRLVNGEWGVLDPTDPERQRMSVRPVRARSGAFHELRMGSGVIDDEGTVVLTYHNADAQGESVIFQVEDGPTLMVPVTGFGANYVRSVGLAVCQLAFLAALGCMVGAAFSTPVAAFVGVCYLIIGMLVQSAVDAPVTNEFGDRVYKGVSDRALHGVAILTSWVVVSVDDFDATSDLATGRLIELRQVAKTVFVLILFRGGLLAGLGMFILTRRELGLVIRR